MQVVPYTVEDVQELYVSIGEGVWHLQHLENTVTIFTTLKILQRKRDKGLKVTEKLYEEILAKQRKLSLGPLIGSAKREKTIPTLLLKQFAEFLGERNWLIHKCVIGEYLSLRNQVTRNQLFYRLEKFTEQAQELNRKMSDLLDSWYKQKGYDLEYVYKLAEESIREAESH